MFHHIDYEIAFFFSLCHKIYVSNEVYYSQFLAFRQVFCDRTAL